MRRESRNKKNVAEIPMRELAASSELVRLCKRLSLMEREWEACVGYTLASRSRPDSFEDGILTIAAENAFVLHDMNFKRTAIQRKIEMKTALEVREIRIEVRNTRRRGKGALGRGRTRRAVKKRPDRIDPMVEAKMTERILSDHADMDPDLAGIIARCRILCGEPGNTGSNG